MRFPVKFGAVFFLLAVCFNQAGVSRADLNLDRLSPEDIAAVKVLLDKLAPLIKEGDEAKTLATLSFEELYAPLNVTERAFLESFKNLDAKALNVKIPFRGIATGKEELVTITGQKIKLPAPSEAAADSNAGRLKAEGEWQELPPQFLPPDVYAAYLKMMDAMEKDIGKRLYVESGYRSSAYQLYLFVFYLQNHEYSIRETVKWVALPGFSEHGAPAHQAIDFINADGISGETHPEDFENLEEYRWLLANAARFNFILSYPKDSPQGLTYEPWHWRYDKPE